MRVHSWKVPAAFACGVLVGASLLSAAWIKAAPSRQKDTGELKLRRLEIVNDKGETIITLSGKKNFAEVVVTEPTSKTQAALIADPKGGTLLLKDATQKNSVLITADKHATGLYFETDDGRKRAYEP